LIGTLQTGRPRVIADMRLKWQSRDEEIRSTAKNLCKMFSACQKQSANKGDWILEAVIGASGLGKTRLGIQILGEVLTEITSKRSEYIGMITGKMNSDTFQKFSKILIHWEIQNCCCKS
jgi:phage terminase large subunit-like protein